MLPFIAGTLITMTGQPCPAGVISQIEGLYKWVVTPEDSGIISQKDRLTPHLYQLLKGTENLSPITDGAFVDFDPFSNTQAQVFGAKVKSCRIQQRNLVAEARVAVSYGLVNVPSGYFQTLDYRMVRVGSRWLISDITYDILTDKPWTLTWELEDVLKEVKKFHQNHTRSE
jgi:hypothetical protein